MYLYEVFFKRIVLLNLITKALSVLHFMTLGLIS